MRGTVPNMAALNTVDASYRATLEPEGDSQSSSSNSPARADYEESDFYTGNNDSQSSIGVPTFQDMAVTETECFAPASRLPAEVLINIFSKLTSTSDLKSCLLVSKRWAKNSVDLLWHRPTCSTWEKHRLICRTVSEESPYFAYRDFIKRLNLASLAPAISDGSVVVLSVCTRIERLTLTNCVALTDQGLKGLLKDCSHLLALDISGDKEITAESMYTLAEHCKRLQGLNITNCKKISNESMVAVAQSCRWIKRVRFLPGLA
jgi:F-box and leucine-rich repeat protein GRR1